jgi:hypothetical protein
MNFPHNFLYLSENFTTFNWNSLNDGRNMIVTEKEEQNVTQEEINVCQNMKVSKVQELVFIIIGKI